MSNADYTNRNKLTRRQALLLSGAAGLGIVLPGTARASDSIKTAAHQEPGTCSTPRSAVAKTQYGKVRGYVDDGVFTFKGIPYGQNTGGENRWLPAKPPKPWEGEYPALIYGPIARSTCMTGIAPAPSRARHAVWGSIEQSFLQDWDDGYLSEDMLKLNVWTPTLTGKRPVMVYFHGGGFSFGSSYELPSQEGAQMARHHDVVQVSVNHRLNILGFFDLVRDRRAGVCRFGERRNDRPGGVASLGAGQHRQFRRRSGPGHDLWPVGRRLQGDHADGHALGGGAVPSRVGAVGRRRQSSERRAIQRVGQTNHERAGTGSERSSAALQKMEWAKLNAAANAAASQDQRARAAEPRDGLAGGVHAARRLGPTVDGRMITMRSFFEVAPEISKNVPMLIGSVSEEGNRMSSRPTEAEWHATLAGILGEAKATALIAAMKKAHPEKSIRTLSYGVSGLLVRNNVTRMAKMKHEQKGAPVFTYYFTWQSPMLEDAGAWHTAELAFCFDNTKRCEQGTGNTPEAQALAKKMATAWANFARTGNPSQPGLTWTPFDPDRCQTMVFDNQCRMVDDPEGEVRKILLS